MAVNLRGTFFLTQAVAKRWIAAGAGKLYRSVVTISSVNAELIGDSRADYCITKSALTMMSKLFAVRLSEAQVGVFEVRPGVIKTDMTAPANATPRRRQGAERVAEGISWARWRTVGRARQRMS